MARRILVTALWHETNTFSPVLTGLEAFDSFLHLSGDAVLDYHRATNTEIGGMIEAAARYDFELVPAVSAAAIPSGLVTAAAFDSLMEETFSHLRAAGPFHGALVGLHGAMVAEGAPDAEAWLVERLRAELGPAVPLVATFDIHANLSPALFAAADVLIGYDTYPHVDMADRGREAAGVLHGILESGRRPHKALRKLPLLTVPQVQATDETPMREAVALLHEAERDGEVTTASVAVGFPYADIAHLGVAVTAYGEDADRVESAADRIAASLWTQRQALVPRLEAPERAVAEALAEAEGPVVLVDVADNVGGGSPGDGTVLLAELQRVGARSAVVVLWDPPAAARAVEIGVAGRFAGTVGGRTDGHHGAPVQLEGEVCLAGPIEYKRDGTYMTDLPVNLGNVGVVKSDGILVVLTERRVMPFDSNHLRILGIEPEKQKVIVVKSAIAWRAAFFAMASRAIYVDTPGICASNLRRYSYRHGATAFYPLNEDAQWPG